ncbi:hypothetical protein FH972_017682 [Carpinus fangiana]|uniref:Uncharacterized protein n=1 Tax=Carpinus fangiana TaxID=176857 RepID=A0A5N6RLQ4_9ROSI|nr:hypothetical protein FH972_017682 [Carpinus fangiana]
MASWPAPPPTLPPLFFLLFFSSPHSFPLSRDSSVSLSPAPHSSPAAPVTLLLRRPPVSRRRPHKLSPPASCIYILVSPIPGSSRASSSSAAAQKPTPKSPREKLYGKLITLADREMVEEKAYEILLEARDFDVAFLIVVDPLGLKNFVHFFETTWPTAMSSCGVIVS